MRLAFLGTPAMSVPPLAALVGAGHQIDLVVTGPDKRRGRGGATSPSPVKQAAIELGLGGVVTHQVDDAVTAAEQGTELGVVVAFGRLIRPHVLAAMPMINLHFSLLPRWRGAAPVERALLAGDEVTGVCVMEVVEALDAGGVYSSVEVPIGPRATADELRAELVTAGTELLIDTLARGLGEPTPQHGETTYARKITTDDLRIDWSRSAAEIDRQIRAGGAWTTFRDRRIKILAAEAPGASGDTIMPTVVQPAGKGPMSYDDWRRGAQPVDGEWFA